MLFPRTANIHSLWLIYFEKRWPNVWKLCKNVAAGKQKKETWYHNSDALQQLVVVFLNFLQAEVYVLFPFWQLRNNNWESIITKPLLKESINWTPQLKFCHMMWILFIKQKEHPSSFLFCFCFFSSFLLFLFRVSLK